MNEQYSIFSLIEMIEELKESYVRNLLSSFSCPLNYDIEYFLKCKSIEFAKQNIAPSYLVFAAHKEQFALCGYFTITLKMFTISKNNISSNAFHRIKKFGTYDEELKSCDIIAPLIAQLGKNYYSGYNRLISGSELLKLACDEIKKAQSIVGGKAVYVECEDNQKLKNFYERNSFRQFAVRDLDPDERGKLPGKHLIQMISYLK